MTQGIGGYGRTDTDELLRRAMEDSGDHDPSRIVSETGHPLHYDATVSAGAHREGLAGDSAALGRAKDAAIDRAMDQALERIAHLAEHYGPAFGALGPIAGAVTGLGALYKSAVEDAKREGELQRALGASDAGVVALAQSLQFDPGFRSYVATAHAGSDNAAAAMTATLAAPERAGMRAELQARADRGFVDAAGYARNAATAMRPLFNEARAKLTGAVRATEPEVRARLTREAGEANARAAEIEAKYLAPVTKDAQADAAYGLGVQAAVFSALTTPASFDAAVARARANVEARAMRAQP